MKKFSTFFLINILVVYKTVNAAEDCEDWSEWSTCTKKCDGKDTKSRTRTCVDVTQRARCFDPICIEWGDWSEWASCNTNRKRICKLKGSDKVARGCTGKSIEVKECNDCTPVWTKWSSWSSCSASCGDRSSRFRKRICVLKYTKYPSDNCKGESFESKDCKVPACPSWGLWGKWGSCSKTCGRDSIQSRSRNCLFKGVATSANSCPGNPNEHRKCGKQGCAVWSEWSEWGICSATCNNGQPINRQRHRTCVIDGTNTQTTGCNGHKTETVDCPLIKGCPVWTSWGPWGECSATCGMLAVTRNRYRRCVHMGSNTSTIGCNGASIETKNCSPVLCPCDCLPEHKTPKRICGILSNGRLHFGSVCEYRQYACGYQGQIRQGSCTDPNIPDR